MNIAIHHRVGSFSSRWIEYCNQKNIPYKVVNCYNDSIIEDLQDCSYVMWHYNHLDPRDKLFAKQLLTSLEHKGIKTFPNIFTAWHFDDKLGQKYLLEALELPCVKTYVFFSKDNALKWVQAVNFPKVFKLRTGAGSASAKLVINQNHAVKLIGRAFGRGFTQYSGLDSLKERIRKYSKGKSNLMDVFKGIFRLAKPPDFSKMAGREVGYIYFQDFIPDNDHDIRVVVVSNKAFAIKKMVRDYDFRASGSGCILYDRNLFSEGVIKLAFHAASKIKSQCIAIDFVFNNGIPLIVEVSYGFSMAGYNDCPGYWDSSMQWHDGSFNPYGWMVDSLVNP